MRSALVQAAARSSPRPAAVTSVQFVFCAELLAANLRQPKLWPNLKQRALERAVREITRKSDLAIRVITYEREKYRKVTAVLFEILVKPQS